MCRHFQRQEIGSVVGFRRLPSSLSISFSVTEDLDIMGRVFKFSEGEKKLHLGREGILGGGNVPVFFVNLCQ